MYYFYFCTTPEKRFETPDMASKRSITINWAGSV